MTAFTLPANVTDSLNRTVDDACAKFKTDIPGTSVVVVGRDGKELFAHAAGKRGVTGSEEMTLDNVFWIASCTKMITGIACMQLVEQEKLHLDDGDELERLIPELEDTHVLTKDGQLVSKNKKITLRMLLTHTGIYPIPKCPDWLWTDCRQLVSDTPFSATSCSTTRSQLASMSSRETSRISFNP
jgi:CubicO group peptidase (beta-lactamase class C family)